LEEDNICFKAYHLLKKDYPLLPAMRMHLHKTIPSAAGLGGGSADGAFTLQLLNQKFRIGLSENQLIAYAAALGSDCPFFIKNKACLAKGRGEILEEVELNLSPYRVIIVNPRIYVSTVLAFKEIEPDGSRESIMNAIIRPVSEWKEHLSNDFEKLIFEKYPEIADLKAQLYNAGALYASMSGSGSSLYGIFKKDAQPLLNFPDHHFVKTL
jgi:4-diphosphocytidyl-2-C-methyl-D-erythritol kinase